MNSTRSSRFSATFSYRILIKNEEDMAVQTLMKVLPLPNSSEVRKKTQITALTPMIWTLSPPIKSMAVT